MTWNLGESMRIASTVLRSGVEMLVQNAWENVSENMHMSKLNKPYARLDGRVCIVTGANAGIGYTTSEALASMGAHVILACRSKARGEAAVQSITKALAGPGGCPDGTSPGKLECMELDLGSLDSVRAFVGSFSRRKLPLHLVICNAGLMSPPERLVSSDGFEMQFQVNFLSHWLLIQGLLSEQRQRRKSSAGSPATARNKTRGGQQLGLVEDGTRVVTLSSVTHYAGSLLWEDVQSERSYSPFISYAFSKLAKVVMAKELQRRFDRNRGYGSDSAVSVHPGIVDTHLANNFFKTQGVAWAGPLAGLLPVYDAIVSASRPLFFRTTANAANTVLYAALAPEAAVAGHYVVPAAHVAQPDKAVEDEAQAVKLWDYAAQLTGLKIDTSLQ